ncbi:LEA type 2 family protein [Desulfobacterium sp. N47]|uniref:Water stress and hypersensitive response domain-containing protein n=1 Tax=uncultured Desulfobacterium sp. TaxID=201089 RepID=E1YDW2_9BACT|nr:hypothetical protein N47_L13540 [uncultured Desulfobacterium sp.]
MLKYPALPALRTFCLFILLLTCFSCGKLLKQPEVHINSVQIKKIKNLEAVFRLNLEVYNPNIVPFNIKHIEYDVEMEGQHIASAVSDEKVSIPIRGAALVPLEVHSNSFDLISAIIKAFIPGSKNGNKKIEFKINGKILLDGIFYGTNTISFSSSGNLLEKFGRPKEQ